MQRWHAGRMVLNHSYSVDLVWRGNHGSGTSGVRDFSRRAVVQAPGSPDIEVAPDRVFHGEANRWNPEQMLLASLAQCHMYSVFHVAVQRRVIITAYRDSPVGRLEVARSGAGAFTDITLAPEVTVAEHWMRDLLPEVHREAHELCFIANSLSVPVRWNPRARVSSDGWADGDG